MVLLVQRNARNYSSMNHDGVELRNVDGEGQVEQIFGVLLGHVVVPGRRILGSFTVIELQDPIVVVPFNGDDTCELDKNEG